MKLGFLECFVVFIVAFVLIGPDKLPAYIKKGVGLLKEFKSYSNKISEEVNDTLVEPLKESTKPITDITDEIMEPLQDVKKVMKKLK